MARPQAVAAGPALTVVPGKSGVLAEQVRQLLRRHASTSTLVGYRDRNMDAIDHGGDPDGRRLGRVSRRVGQEVVQNLHDALPVGHHPRQLRRQVDAHGVTAAAAGERVPRLVHQRGHVRRLRVDRQRAGLDAPRVQQVADQPVHLVCLAPR